MDELNELYEVMQIIMNEKTVEIPAIPIFSFEGLPGAGKTTQIKLVSDILSRTYGKSSYIDLPTKSSIGKILKSLYSDQKQWNDIRMLNPWLNPLLISADLRLAIQKAIENEAKYAFMSRGILSTYYYNLDAYSVDEEIAWNMMEKHVSAFYKPTAIVFMDIPVEEAYKRVVKRNRGPLRNMDHMDVMRKDKQRLQRYLNKLPNIPVHYIDAIGSEAEVSNRIITTLEGYLRNE